MATRGRIISALKMSIPQKSGPGVPDEVVIDERHLPGDSRFMLIGGRGAEARKGCSARSAGGIVMERDEKKTADWAPRGAGLEWLV